MMGRSMYERDHFTNVFVLFVFFFVPFVYKPQLTSEASIRKFKFLLLGGRPMVGLQTLDLAIGVRVPASQPQIAILPLSPGNLNY